MFPYDEVVLGLIIGAIWVCARGASRRFRIVVLVGVAAAFTVYILKAGIPGILNQSKEVQSALFSRPHFAVALTVGAVIALVLHIVLRSSRSR